MHPFYVCLFSFNHFEKHTQFQEKTQILCEDATREQMPLTRKWCTTTAVSLCLLGGSLSSVGFLSGSSWIAMLPSKLEFAKFIMKVTVERPSEDDCDEPDVQVVEFWKRMGFEDIAEASAVRITRQYD